MAFTMPTIADFIRLNHRRFPDRIAATGDDGRLTHRQLSERAWGLARGLIASGVRPGDRVGVLSGNSVFALETFLGCAAAGAVYTAFNWRWATEELVHGITMTRPSVVLVEREFREAFDAAMATGRLPGTLEVRHAGADYEALLLPGAPGDVVLPAPEDPAVILFTGGTTGSSKGVVLSHRAALANALNELVDLGFGAPPGQVGLSLTPLFHSAALLCVFAPHYVTGGTSATLRRFTEEGFAEVVAKERVTSTFIVPNMLRRLLNVGILDRPEVASLRQLHSGGGLLRMPDIAAIKAVLPEVELIFRYGLTEGGPMVTRLPDEDILRPELDGSIGAEYVLCEVQLRDADDREVPPGELGEICVRGPSVMDGYFDRPDATAEALRGGWLHTGDLAVRDENGYIFFRDRAKDMIKSGGENVYAAEIEQLLYAHPGVMECGVLGIPSVEWGEEVRAVVAIREGHAVTEAELRDYLRERLAGYKIPKVFKFLEPSQMPVNPSGKVVKRELREAAGW